MMDKWECVTCNSDPERSNLDFGGQSTKADMTAL